MSWIKLSDIEKHFGAPLDEFYLIGKKVRNRNGYVGILDSYISGAISGYEMIDSDGFLTFYSSDIVSYYEDNQKLIQ